MNQPIVSGSWKASGKVAMGLWGFGVVIDIIMLVAGIGVRSSARRGSIEETLAIFLIVLGALGLVFSLYKLSLEVLAYNSGISVYEDAIRGNGQTSKFSLPQEFDLPIRDVRNVDIIKARGAAFGLVVYTQYANYTCYLNNCDEVRNKIVELIDAQKKTSQAEEST